MGNNYIFSLTPTFTQGLVLGQASILLLLWLILKYLFLESEPTSLDPGHPSYTTSNLEKERVAARSQFRDGGVGIGRDEEVSESAEWFNVVLQQVSSLSTSPYAFGV